MKYILFLVFSFLHSTIILANTPLDGVSLKSLDRQICDAYLNKDLETIKKLVHKDFIVIDSSGSVIKNSKNVDLKSLKDDLLRYSKIDLTEVEERVYGSTGYVFGIATLEGEASERKGGEKKPFKLKVRYSETWTKLNSGKWQLVGEQLTDLKN